MNLPLATLLSMPLRQVVQALPPEFHAVAGDLQQCCSAVHQRARQLLERTNRAGIQTISITEEDYPQRLRDTLQENAPPLLFTAGDATLLGAAAAAVLGAREPLLGGEHTAAACAEILASDGVTIVSGGMRGADWAAHESALLTGGKTIVVLPQGILTYRAPSLLFDAINKRRAIIVSEFAPDAHWEKHAAATRDATISALSRLVCVIEPDGRITAGLCSECRLSAQDKRLLVSPLREAAAVTLGMSNSSVLELIEGQHPVGIEELADLWRTASVRIQEQWTSLDSA
jgi:predicted Rossmann fold nucleotide-binding protein DprA/Smf involved in DNA uptake